LSLTFRYAGILVADVPKTVSFYEHAFGLSLRYMHPSSGYAELATGDTLLCFISEDFVSKTELLGSLVYRPNRAGAEAAAGLIAFVTDDLKGDWQRAVAAGCEVVKAPEGKPWGQTTGYLRDLNGAVVELCTRSPRDTA
jgi:uncharacterized glyoxalase superfamily protein PhnB